MKINDFWGDLTDISAKKEALKQSLLVKLLKRKYQFGHPENDIFRL